MITRILWYVVSIIFFENSIPWPSYVRSRMLIIFGAKLGKRVIIKCHVQIKYPWNLLIGDDAWIGEKVWIDNLGKVSIGSNTCLSQSVHIITGSHDFNNVGFDLIVKPIVIGNSCWIAAGSMVLQGVVVADNSLVYARSLVRRNIGNNDYVDSYEG